MRNVLLVGLAVVGASALVSRILRGRAEGQADLVLAVSAVLVRLLAAVVFGGIAARALEDPDPLWIGVAVFFSLLALGAALTAVLLVLGFAMERRERSSGESRSPRF